MLFRSSFAPGGTATCGFTNQAKGQINVTKQVEGGNGSFTFSLSPGGGAISLTGGISAATVTLTGSFTGLAPGTTFTVSEGANASFTAVGSMSCMTSFAPGGTATCGFTNQAKGQINVTKQVEGGNGSFTFSLSPGGGAISLTGGVSASDVTLTGSFTGLAPGTTFTVSEGANASFTAVGSMSCMTSFAPGGTATCGFTNQAKGQINVTKQVEGGNGSFTFSLSPGGGAISLTGGISAATVTLTRSFTGLAPGTTFTVSEGANASFTAVGSMSCMTSFAPRGTGTCGFTHHGQSQINLTKQVQV